MKDLNKILNETTGRIYYAKHAEQLHMLALTEFVRKIEKKGAIILSCCPKQIKLDDGRVEKVIGSYIKYTYNKGSICCIQFDSNPFFGCMGYVTQENGASTGMTDINQVYDDVNEYLVSEKNINSLVKNLIGVEKHLMTLTPMHWDSSKINFKKQEIYKF